jgi:glyoxalase family protein
VTHPVLGLHHVTATVGAAQPDLDFAIETLGLRLVKKTVNFDDRRVYHFYYGDERGTPGTIWTTFPYQGRGVRFGSKGAGQITVTSFSVPPGSLNYWRKRLSEGGFIVRDVPPRFNDDAIQVSDPSGLVFELVAASDARTPWTAIVEEPHAIRGIHSVTMTVRATEQTLALMTGLLGFVLLDEEEDRLRVSAGGNAPGHLIDIVRVPETTTALNGIGTVHHVAMAIANADEQLRLQQELIRYGAQVTDVRDRCYFTSIYFREPGGVLFEVATVSPGFTADEPVAQLGRGLMLPPWEEPHRATIEAGLAPITYR